MFTYGEEGRRDEEEHIDFLARLARRSATRADVDAVLKEIYGDGVPQVSVVYDGQHYASSVCGSSDVNRRDVDVKKGHSR